jgi:hypothetical protein
MRFYSQETCQHAFQHLYRWTISISKIDCPVVGSEEWEHIQDVPYRETIGSLTNICRSDIAYSVCVASRYLANPGTKHWNHVKRMLRYLKASREYVFQLDPGPILELRIQERKASGTTHDTIAVRNQSRSINLL